MMNIDSWPLAVHILVLATSGLAVAFIGTHLARLAQRLAQRTGLGQAITGAIFLGASTSLSGIVTSVTASVQGHAELAAGNAVGGIAAQTVFLAVADWAYRKANLEHAAASDENMLQGALLICLLSLSMLAAFLPPLSVIGIHPISIVLILSYIFGQRLIHRAKGKDMWHPRVTEYTQREERPGISRSTRSESDSRSGSQSESQSESTSDRDSRQASNDGTQKPMAVLWLKFAAAAVSIGLLGYLLARSGVVIAGRTGINETVIGGIFTAVSTSFPELVTAVAAVRIGALTLAVSDIIGGNAFDILFLSVADIVFREGSLYHAMGTRPMFLIMLTILLTSVLLMGLIRREKHGIVNIGFESALLFLLYGGGFALIILVL
jgi:cation:H+ antiporter